MVTEFHFLLFVTNTAAFLGTWDFGTGVYGRYEDMDGILSFFFCVSRREGLAG
jgi:hypothetical protein